MVYKYLQKNEEVNIMFTRNKGKGYGEAGKKWFFHFSSYTFFLCPFQRPNRKENTTLKTVYE